MSDVNITNNYYAPIGQHIDHVDVVNLYMTPDGRVTIARADAIRHQPVDLPSDSPLATELAEALFSQARAAGWLDAQNQPQELSRARVAMLADHIGHLLQLPQDRRWQPFEEFWGRRNMRADLQKALKASYYADFAKALNQRITI